MSKTETKDDHGRAEIQSWDEVPVFRDEAEEQTWWDNHTLGEAVLKSFRPVPKEGDDTLPPARAKTFSRATSLRLDENTLTRLRALAHKKRLPYQTLLKSFVLERLYEEEKREGIL